MVSVVAAVVNEAKIRAAMKAQAEWAVAHPTALNYSQARPIPYSQWDHHQPVIETDCSGSYICIAHAAGAPDPSGQHYDGEGYTGSIAGNLRHVGRAADLGIGDAIGYGDLVDVNSHITMVVEPGDDPLCFTFGANPPALVRYSTEVNERRAGGEPVNPITFMQLLPRTPPLPPKKRRPWSVAIAAGGEVLAVLHGWPWAVARARTGLWRARHPRKWRSVTGVSYHRRPRHPGG
jgi:hypothetical protein